MCVASLPSPARLDFNLFLSCSRAHLSLPRPGLTEWLPNWRRKGFKNSTGAGVVNVDLIQHLATLIDLRRGSTSSVHSSHPPTKKFDSDSEIDDGPVDFVLELGGRKGKRTGGIKFVHVKAHVGLEGNERADVSRPLNSPLSYALRGTGSLKLKREPTATDASFFSLFLFVAVADSRQRRSSPSYAYAGPTIRTYPRFAFFLFDKTSRQTNSQEGHDAKGGGGGAFGGR